jgi:hypothetical protein
MAEKISTPPRYLNQFKNRNLVSEPVILTVDMSPVMVSMQSLQEKIDDVSSQLNKTTESIYNIASVIPPSNAIDPRKWYSNKEIPNQVDSKTFMLINSPSISSEHVYLNGMLIKDGDFLDYTIEDNLIIFSEDIPKGSKIICTYYYEYEGSLKGYVNRETPTGPINNSNALFILENSPLEGTEHVYLNGILQEKNSNADYTLDGKNITFAYPPLENTIIQVTYEYSMTPPLRLFSYKEIPQGSINSRNLVFTLEYTPVDNSEHVYLNGVLQEPNSDYTLNEKNIIFILPPPTDSKITCTYYYTK